MKHLTSLFLVILLAVSAYSQTGTIGDPFTSLHQSATVTSAGIYYFNIGGTTFNTHVDANGYVQIAIDFGNGTGNLPQGTSLTTSSRGILNTTVLATLTQTVEVRISTSNGNNDVTTTNSTIISRIQSNSTLHGGTADNTINNGWTGTNAALFTGNASCTTSSGTSLHQNIFHPCGNSATFHWIPSGNLQREIFSSGEVANSVSFHLWVKGNAAIALPIELVDFNVILVDNNFVKLNWQTASEINNDFFTVERSKNGTDWQELTKLNGAGNSSALQSYSSFDNNPYYGISYYRLKQTDFNGKFSYSQIRSVNIERGKNSSIEIYPNPAHDKITIVGSEIELSEISIYNTLGQNVTSLSKQIINNSTSSIIDLSQLSQGIYYIKTKTTANKVYKQ